MTLSNTPIKVAPLTLYSNSSSNITSSPQPPNTTDNALPTSSPQKRTYDSRRGLEKKESRDGEQEKLKLGASGGVPTGWKCGHCGTVQSVGSVQQCVT
jgi:hypothetical protein